MKLYQADLSPFASRVRMQVYAKGLDHEAITLELPPGGMGSAEFKRINPTGKIPALDTGSRVLPESEVICEYLEDRFPQPPLRPGSALDRAQTRLLARWVDMYGYPRMAPLYAQVDPASRDADTLAAGLTAADEALAILARLLGDGGYSGGPFAVGSSLTLADCALVPMLFFVDAVLPVLGRSQAFAAAPLVERYWRSASQDAVAARIVGEMGTALAAMIQTRAR
ncbi:MAG: glutathione S-transferase family protein [Pseudomonadales bacterium]